MPLRPALHYMYSCSTATPTGLALVGTAHLTSSLFECLDYNSISRRFQSYCQSQQCFFLENPAFTSRTLVTLWRSEGWNIIRVLGNRAVFVDSNYYPLSIQIISIGKRISFIQKVEKSDRKFKVHTKTNLKGTLFESPKESSVRN